MKLFRLNVAIVLLLLLVVSSINFYVNPYGYYGNNQLAAGTVSLSLYKLKHLKSDTVKPQAIIFGSSNALSMDPDWITSRTGLKTYNYGIFQFTVEDLYCSVRALYENNIHPKLIVLCVDDWLLADRPSPKDEVFKGSQNRLSYKPELSKYLPDYSWLRLDWCRFKSSLSIEQVQTTLPELKRRLLDRNFTPLSDQELMLFFNDNGTRKKITNADNIDITDSAEAGKYDVGGFLKKRHESLKRYPDRPMGLLTVGQEIFQTYSERRIQLLTETLEFLNANNCKVILNIMPVQPYYQTLIEQNTNYDDRISKLVQLCDTYKKKYPNIIIFKDNHKIENFNGKANYFFDEIHLTSSNSTLMLESLFNNIPKDAFQ